MSEQIQQIRMMKSRRETTADTVVFIASFVVLYYLANPDARSRHSDAVHGFCERWVHRVSVWQALQAIRSLPETK